jgi:hypothetical protein
LTSAKLKRFEIGSWGISLGLPDLAKDTGRVKESLLSSKLLGIAKNHDCLYKMRPLAFGC